MFEVLKKSLNFLDIYPAAIFTGGALLCSLPRDCEANFYSENLLLRKTADEKQFYSWTHEVLDPLYLL